MIEKIMKAVKRGNKKRGRNITIGAVVGMLLSYTAVMGADEYLLIKNDGEIKFSKDNGKNWEDGNPYPDNNWNGIEYINNITLSELRLSGDLNDLQFINNASLTGAYGIYFDSSIETLINRGLIIGTGNTGYGIYNSGSSITILTNSGLISGTATGNTGSGIYNFGSNITTLTNRGLIIGTGNTGSGIYNSGSSNITTLTNRGLIIGTGNTGSGIYNSGSSNITTLTNSGLISGTATGNNESSGIYNEGSSIETLTNSGLISGTKSKYGYGIYNFSGSSIETLTNRGLITGIGDELSSGIFNVGSITTLVNSGLIDDSRYGIDSSSSSITTLTNSGLISGTATRNTGYGICNSYGSIGTITNTGVIFGTMSAIKNDGGTITSAYNYGILVSGSGDKVVEGISIVAFTSTPNNNEISNYGLAFVADSGNYKNYDNSSSNFGAIYTNKNIDGVNYDIINIGADVNSVSKEITNLKSLGIKDGKLYSNADNIVGGEISDFSPSKQYILNGIEDTLKVIGTDEKNILNNSIINAYKTAIKFDAAGGKLTLSGTTVNGGIDGKSDAISGNGKADILILQNTTVNGKIDMGDDNDILSVGNETIINGSISMGAGNDILTIGTGTIINGTLDGGTGSDTLNFGISSKTRANTADEINILHDISGFENMNINTNVILFETTVKNDGSITDLTVTGAGNITIGENGMLTLRIDSANGNKHALSTGNSGTIKSENGGKLLLALNGAGNTSTISFGNLALDGSLVTGLEGRYQEDVTLDTTSVLHSVEKTGGTNEIKVTAKVNLPTRPTNPDNVTYEKLNKIYHSLCSPQVDGLGNFNIDNDEKLSIFLGYLNDIYAGNPYSYSSELSRKSVGMFRDIIAENSFKPETNKWMIYGGLTHVDGGTKDTYYGKGYYTYDIGSSDMDADTKITGAYILGEYGVSDTLTSGVVIGGNKLKSDLSNGSKVDGDALYLGAYAKKYLGNLKVTGGAGFQYGDYDADRLAVNNAASSIAEPVMKYSDNYNDMAYDIYLNGRYSHNIGDNLFLEPYGTLSYTYIKQDGADEGNKALAIETDSKSFDYTVGKIGVDLKKAIPHSAGKSTLTAGISYTKILDGAEEEYITGRFKGGSDFDILVAHKNEHSIGLNAKYALELENGILFDVKGTYSVERDSNNNSGKNKTKGEWIVGTGVGYKF